MTNEKLNTEEIEREWAIVRVPCTDGVERIGIDMHGWGEERTIIKDLTYDEAIIQCDKKSKELGLRMYNGENSPGYDVDWTKVNFK